MSRMPTARCNACGNYLHTASPMPDVPDRAWLLGHGFVSRGLNRFYHSGNCLGAPVVTVDLFPGDDAMLGVVECQYVADKINERRTIVNLDPTTADVEALLDICNPTQDAGRRSQGQEGGPL